NVLLAWLTWCWVLGGIGLAVWIMERLQEGIAAVDGRPRLITFQTGMRDIGRLHEAKRHRVGFRDRARPRWVRGRQRPRRQVRRGSPRGSRGQIPEAYLPFDRLHRGDHRALGD